MYRKEEPNLTPAIRKWFPKIRYCLQRYIERDRGNIRDCDDLKQKAIDSHIHCYVHTGFCSLSEVDLLHILRVTSTEILDTDIMGMSAKVMSECRKMKLKKK